MELAAVVSSYWARHRLGLGNRESRLRAEAAELAWAWAVVEEAVHNGTADVLTLLDALVSAPDADPCYLGAGPVEELLVHHGARFDTAIAERCAQSEQWREAVGCVWLDEVEERKLTAVRRFLSRGRPGG